MSHHFQYISSLPSEAIEQYLQENFENFQITNRENESVSSGNSFTMISPGDGPMRLAVTATLTRNEDSTPNISISGIFPLLVPDDHESLEIQIEEIDTDTHSPHAVIHGIWSELPLTFIDPFFYRTGPAYAVGETIPIYLQGTGRRIYGSHADKAAPTETYEEFEEEMLTEALRKSGVDLIVKAPANDEYSIEKYPDQFVISFKVRDLSQKSLIGEAFHLFYQEIERPDFDSLRIPSLVGREFMSEGAFLQEAEQACGLFIFLGSPIKPIHFLEAPSTNP